MRVVSIDIDYDGRNTPLQNKDFSGKTSAAEPEYLEFTLEKPIEAANAMRWKNRKAVSDDKSQQPDMPAP